MNNDDYSIIQQCLAGDRNTFNALVERYQRNVFLTILRMISNPDTARDLSQEVFVKAFTRLHTYDPRYPFKTWIQRIAVNRTIDHLRRNRPEVLLLDRENEDGKTAYRDFVPDESPRQDARMERSEIAEQVRSAVSSLEPKLRAVVVLRHFQEMTYEEISSILKIPMGTVKNRLFRAREALESILVSEGEFHKEMAR